MLQYPAREGEGAGPHRQAINYKTCGRWRMGQKVCTRWCFRKGGPAAPTRHMTHPPTTAPLAALATPLRAHARDSSRRCALRGSARCARYARCARCARLLVLRSLRSLRVRGCAALRVLRYGRTLAIARGDAPYATHATLRYAPQATHHRLRTTGYARFARYAPQATHHIVPPIQKTHSCDAYVCFAHVAQRRVETFRKVVPI